MRRVGRARVGDPRGGGRGGHRQRAAQRAPLLRSTLAARLRETWAFGLLAATTVQRIAQRAVNDHANQDGPTSPSELVQLSELRTSGAHPQNCNAELSNSVRKAHGAPPPMKFDLEMKSLKRRDGEEVRITLSRNQLNQL